MNTILQKRIEEAAHQYIQSDAVASENMQLAFGDFINGAKWVLQNQWISVEEALPEYKEPIIVKKGTEYAFASFQNGNFYIVGNIGKIEDVTHWMSVPKLKGGEE